MGGAAVLGRHRLASETAVSNDGSRVYFVAYGVLASNANSQGATAVRDDANLYVYDTDSGETSFIATLPEKDVVAEGGAAAGLVAEPDVVRPAVPTPDGGVLVFASAGNLTGQNPGGEFSEIYRYTAGDGWLVCVSCTPSGVAPTGSADLGETGCGACMTERGFLPRSSAMAIGVLRYPGFAGR